MADTISQHPIMAYVALVLPLILFVLGVVFGANLLLLMAVVGWFGVALLVLFLPLAEDNGSGA